MQPEIIAIIQARMTSTRLPGKVLMNVMGRPLLSYQIERLRFSKMIDKIIIATTANKEDNPIVELCQKEDIIFKAHPEIYALNADIVRNEGLLKSLKADEYCVKSNIL